MARPTIPTHQLKGLACIMTETQQGCLALAVPEILQATADSFARATVNAGSSERPFGGYFDQVADDLERAYPDFADAIERVVVDRGELTLHIKRERLVEVASHPAR